MYVDLVKAIETMNRKALWEVLGKFGMPDHFVNVLVRPHASVVVNVKTGAEGTVVGSLTGVRQGACEVPILFLFVIQAVLETIEWPVTRPTFRTRTDEVTSGVRFKSKRGVASFKLFASLFAGDCAILFETKEYTVTGAPYFFNHLRKLA